MESYDYAKYRKLYNTDKELTNIVQGEDTVIRKFCSVMKRCSSEISKEDSKLFEEIIPNLKWVYLVNEYSNHIENPFKIIWFKLYDGDWEVPEDDEFFEVYWRIATRVKMSDEEFISSYYKVICEIVKCWIEFSLNPTHIEKKVILDDGSIKFIPTIEIYNKNVDYFNNMLTIVKKLIILEKKYCKNLNICRDYRYFKEIENGFKIEMIGEKRV